MDDKKSNSNKISGLFIKLSETNQIQLTQAAEQLQKTQQKLRVGKKKSSK
jgi:hypothetical protein